MSKNASIIKKFKQDFSLNTDNLTDYVKANENELLKESFFTGKTSKMVSIQTGVKAGMEVQLNRLQTTVTLGEGHPCDFIPGDTTTPSNRKLKGKGFFSHEAICPNDLEKFFIGLLMKPGAKQEELPSIYATEYTRLKSGLVSQILEICDWQGDTDSGNANLNKYDGFIKTILNAGGVVEANVTGAGFTQVTEFTPTNIIEILVQVAKKIPLGVMESADTRIMIGTDIAQMINGKLLTANYFHLFTDSVNQNQWTVNIPGLPVIEATPGLDGQEVIFAGNPKNLFIGVDMEGEEDKFDMYWDMSTKKLRWELVGTRCTQIGIPSELVKFTLPAIS